MTFVTKDSGARRDFATGSRRDVDTDKPFIRRIPPIVRLRLGALYRRGADKYGDANDPIENWKKGQPLHELQESEHRHQTLSEMGDESEDHDAAVLWNRAAIIWTKDQIRRGNLPESLADAYNAVVREYGGVEIRGPRPVGGQLGLTAEERASLERDPRKAELIRRGLVETN